MSAHTPGPWSTKFEFGSTTVFGKCEPVANCFTAEDATLIAAAPDMAEALRQIAYGPFGPAEASDREILEAITNLARTVLTKAGL